MKALFSEKNIVVVLFVMVLVTFALAQEDTKKMERLYQGAGNTAVAEVTSAVATKTLAEQSKSVATILPQTTRQ